MKYKIIICAAALAGSLGVVKAEEVIRFAHMNGPSHFVHTEAAAMAERVRERTDGQVRIDLFPSGQLGESAQLVEQMAFGADLMGQVQAGNLADYVPDFSIIVYPFMYGGIEDVERLIGSDLVTQLNEQVLQNNLRVMCYLHYGTRDLYTRNREARSPAETADMAIRVQPVTIYTQMVERVMGGSPTPIPWPEVYSALAQGVIDAAEAPPLSIIDQRHYEHARFLIQTNHIQDIVPLVISASQFDRLSPEHQDILQTEADAACAAMSAASIASYETGISKLRDNGMTIISDVDRAAFAERAGTIAESFPEWTPGLYERARAIIDSK
ncbi:TRAP transporter substrate-binding protein [Aureimonas fodinaquatilis]|uniref:TRAP transporter substrate-binding protein n=1 Tax=Aureimonas fodinaquatilis TaxID=2565783 RepID=A0A5B0E1Z7_9HYPH|nr:TRAP transporter substrate-binding protein [Aureimonas fodinaquatilis]KAA0972145.1 TRAP transporter substrate-binding protein [Aureimonas fodinaquatilis]